MLKENQIIKIRWVGANRKHYENLGYKFTKYNDFFEVQLEHLLKCSNVKVKVICDYCGKEYETTYNHYLEGISKNNKNACSSCRSKKKAETTLKERQEKLYKDAIEACRKKGYEFLSKVEDIINNITYIKYKCPIHGVQEARISNLISGKGCPDCSTEQKRNKYKMNGDIVEERIKQCGGILLNKNEYKNQTEKNLKVICPNCQNVFVTSLRNFTQHEGQLCPNCTNGNKSNGEIRVENYLIEKNIDYIFQYKFEDCKVINPLPFDFYIPNLNTIIEFDGIQHFEETDYFSYSFEKTHLHDEIKNEYCNKNNITLIRISYKDMNNIEKILNTKLNFT